MARLYASIAAALLGTTVGCNVLEPEGPAQRTLLVQHHAEECIGVWYQLCLLVKAPGESEFLRHYSGIEGFAYEWGYVYEIEVEDHRGANPPQDGSSVRTALRKVVSREPVPAGTEFEMFLTGSAHRVVEVAPNRYSIYGAAEFICPEGTACAELRVQIAAGARIGYRFRQPAARDLPLTVVRWEICDAALAGSRSCSF
ncbi:MAG TPA: DUF4377 domain-containing protein [Longimicrobiaceae bacterium]|nr:DUF4377 domain-containing protein [Longimicrobiaceae bacterium]